MTDKEIKIDGVDVSGCEFLCNKGYWCQQHKILVGTNKLQKGDGLITCKDKINCYYKQLKRKEQECEKLKKELQSYKCQEKFPNQCRCAFRCLGNDYCEDAERAINRYKKPLDEIGRLANKAINKEFATEGILYTEGMKTLGYYVLDRINKAKEVND